MESNLIEIIERVITPIVKKAVNEALRDSVPKAPKYGRLMSAEQLARESGYSKHTIYQKNSERQIPGAVKVGGGKLMFETEVVLQWVKDGCPKI